MKKIFFLITILTVIGFSSAMAQTAFETQLTNFTIGAYLNKPIDTLIAHLPSDNGKVLTILSASNIAKGASLQIDYSDSQYWVEIDIVNPQYITVDRDIHVKAEVAWPFSLLRKEKVGSVSIHSGTGQIINHADIY
jgi:hypothetical protein